MKKREQCKRLIMFFASMAIVAILTAVFAFVWYRFFADNKEAILKVFWKRGDYVVVGLYAVMTFLFFQLYGGFKVGYLRVYEVVYSQILSVLCVNFITYLQLCLIGRWKFGMYSMFIVGMTVVDVALIFLYVLGMRWFYLKLYPPRKMLLIYGEYSPDGLIRKMATRKDKYKIESVISCHEDITTIQQRILEYPAVVLADIPAEIRNKLLKFCFRNDIRCYSVPKISDIMIMSAADIHLFDTALLLFRNIGLSIEQMFVKRLFDIVVSVIALVVASPFMLVIALCIKCYDRGPVFFTQERLTKDGKVFKIYKFRSMRIQKEPAEYCMTQKEDKRITPVGKIIRAIHFDELPQLINILKGEMSFVGPRPECPHIAKQYGQMIPEFDFRLKVKAGLTGFAQIYGKYNTTPYDKLKLDLTYIENYTFLLDIKLMLLTFKILFQKDNTEGLESWQTTAATVENLQKLKEEEEKETLQQAH